MGASGHKLGLRLFLEGLEVPVVAANVSIGLNAPATASIQVVPGDKLLELKPRTMVHLFFWDYTMDNEPSIDIRDPDMVADMMGITVDEANNVIANHPEALDAFDELRGYKLLFSGEIIGLTMMKTPVGRQAVLQCSDFSTYWDTTYQFFVSYSPNGNFLGTSAAVWAGSSSMFDDLTAGHVSVMNEYLRSKPKTPGLQKVKGLVGGIIALLEAMGGVPNHTHGVNDFFTIAELKNHLLQQIVAEENDDTAQRLFDDKAFMDWLTRGMSSLGQLTTFRDMMKLLFNYVYYEVVPNPAAMYVPAVKPKTTKKTVGVPTEPADLAAIEFVQRMILDSQATKGKAYPVDAHTEMAKSLIGRLDQLESSSILKAPATNVLDSNGEIVGRTRKQVDGRKFSKRALNLIRTLKEQLRALKTLPPGGDRNVFDSNGEIIARTRSVPAKLAVALSETRRQWDAIIRNYNSLLAELSKTQVEMREKVTSTGAELDRLHTQIFRPDCFFVAPPRCNVLFPEQYTQFNFSRNFLQEVTRLRLSVGWLFGADSGGLLAEYHFAPATKDIQALAKKQGNGSIRALLPWEIYSGILPKFETVHEVNYVAGRAERKKGISKGKIVGQAKNYPQRVANFNYMKYRFAARTIEVSAKFNPFMVAGFPALIVERPFIIDPNNPNDAQKLQSVLAEVNSGNEQKIAKDDISDHIRDIARAFGAPSQYLGMVAALSHNVDQSGGGTSVVMTHGRTHRVTDDDFLNIFSKEVTNEAETEYVSTIIDAEAALGKGDWKSLKILVDATDQDMGEKLAQLEIEAQQAKQESDDGLVSDTELASRPDGSPDLGSVSALSSFAPLLNMPPPERDFALSDPGGIASPDQRVKLRGRVKQSRLKGSRKVILEPDPYGKLKIGAKGPKGGKIVQIQLFSDDAIMVTGVDVNKNAFVYKPVIIGEGTIDEFVLDDKTGKVKQKKVKGKVVKDTSRLFMWRRIVIHEEKKLATKITKTIPVEEALRPPWFSPLYSNWFIGDEIYQPFFGTGSIVDQALFVSPQGQATFGTGRSKQAELTAKLRDADGDHKKIVQILEDAKADGLSDVPDIESSADALAYVYGEVRRLGLDVNKFVHDYTRRPIATMKEILGSADLRYDVSGDKLNLVQGTPGFHSTAIADVGGQLRGLLDNPDLQLNRLTKGGGKKSPLSRDLDPRPGRRAQVAAYLEEINASTGSLGVGIPG